MSFSQAHTLSFYTMDYAEALNEHIHYEAPNNQSEMLVQLKDDLQALTYTATQANPP